MKPKPKPKIAKRAKRALPDGAKELRRFLRQKITAVGTTRFGGWKYNVTFEDLSEQGCQFWIPRHTGLPIRSRISLYIDTLGPFEATVRWSRQGWIGVEFDLPVYQPVLDHMREAHSGDPE